MRQGVETVLGLANKAAIIFLTTLGLLTIALVASFADQPGQKSPTNQDLGALSVLRRVQLSFSPPHGANTEIYNMYYKEAEREYKMLSDNEESQNIQMMIGFDHIDINNDGEEEVFAYNTLQDYCGSSGCTLNIYMKDHAERWFAIKFDHGDGVNTYGSVAVLNAAAKGFHDLAFQLSDGSYAVWRWDGEKYERLGEVRNLSDQGRAGDGWQL